MIRCPDCGKRLFLDSAQLSWGGWEAKNRVITANSRTTYVSELQFSTFQVLLRAKGEMLAHDRIRGLVYGNPASGELPTINNISVQLVHLRKRILHDLRLWNPIGYRVGRGGGSFLRTVEEAGLAP